MLVTLLYNRIIIICCRVMMKCDRLKIKTTKCFKSKYEEKQYLKKMMAYTESRASQTTENKISSIYIEN